MSRTIHWVPSNTQPGVFHCMGRGLVATISCLGKWLQISRDFSDQRKLKLTIDMEEMGTIPMLDKATKYVKFVEDLE